MNKIWAADMTQQLKVFVEQKFTERTPPTRVDEVLPETRVSRSEMRTWSLKKYGLLPPELDVDWGQDFADWYVEMAKRVMKTKGEKSPHAKRLGKGLRY